MPSYSKKAWRNLFEMGGGQIGALFFGLGSTLLWTHLVPKEIYGQYQLIFSFIVLATSFSLSGLSESATLSAAKGFDGNYWPIFGYKFLMDLIGSIILAVIGYGYLKTQPTLAHALWIAALLYPFIYLQNIWSPWLTGKERFTLMGRLQTLEPFLSLLVLTTLLFAGIRSVPLLLGSNLLETGLFGIAITWFLHRSRSTNNRDPSIIRYGLHVSFINLLGGLCVTDKFMIDHYLSASAVAVYALAQFMPQQMKIIYLIFSRLLSPTIYRAKSLREAWLYLRRRLLPIYAFFATLGLVGFFLLPYIIPMLFSKQYQEAVPYARWLWLWWGLTCPIGFIYMAMMAQRKRIIIMAHSVSYPLMLGTLFAILIPRYGLWGALGANLVTGFCSGVMHISAFTYYLNKEIRT